MTIRRKLKTDREFIADAKKITLKFCESQGDCRRCPLRPIKEEHNVGCIAAYLIYMTDYN